MEAVDEVPAEIDQPPLLPKRTRTDREIVLERDEHGEQEREQYARAQNLRQIDGQVMVRSQKIEKRLHQLLIS